MLRWVRPRFVATTRVAELDFLALLTSPRIDDALDEARAAAGDAVFDALDIDVRARAGDDGYLAEVLAGRAGLSLEALPSEAQHELRACPRYARIAAHIPDPPALDVLQAALAVIAALAGHDDLTGALDLATSRWLLPAEVAALAPERRFDLDEHVQVVVEAVERRPGAGHLVRSRGLGKLARPDVCAHAPRREAHLISEVVRDVARVLAEGAAVSPGDSLGVRDLPPCTLVPRAADGLGPGDAADAPLYEIVDLGPDGPGTDCAALLAASRPRPRLKVIR